MNDNIKTWNPGTEQIFEAELTKVALKYGASTAIKDHVRPRLQLHWTYNDPFFTVQDDEGGSLPLDSYFAKLKSDPRYSQEFANTNLPRISVHDQSGLHARFEDIANGKVAVADE